MDWIVAGALLISPFASAEFADSGTASLLKLPELNTRAGRSYHGVTITAKRPDGITILHEEGSARIPYEVLPAALVEELGGFDPEIARVYRTASEKALAAAEAQSDREYAVTAEKLRLARRELQERANRESAAAAAARQVVAVNPLRLPARPLSGDTGLSVSTGSYFSSDPVTVVETEVAPSYSSSCPPPCPPPWRPCGTTDKPEPPCKPWNPCGTNSGPKPPQPPQPPYPCGNTDAKPPVRPSSGGASNNMNVDGGSSGASSQPAPRPSAPPPAMPAPSMPAPPSMPVAGKVAR